jgi:hypothetical protein
MKKALVVLLILALAGGLFAQEFTLNGRVDAWLVPFQFIDRDGDALMGAGLGRDNGGGIGTRARIFGEAKTDTLGLKIQLQFLPVVPTGTSPIAFDDNVEIWWKPVEFFQLDVGKFVSDPLRGKIGDSWMDGLTVNSYGNDEIFNRFNSNGTGVLASFNFGGLFIGALVPKLTSFGASTAFGKGSVYETVDYASGTGEIGRVYERIQFAAGYTIPGIGLVRAQYLGDNVTLNTTTGTGTTPRIEAAFALTAVPGLTLDIGGKVPLPIKGDAVKTWNGTDFKWEDTTKTDDKSTLQLPYQVSAGASYKADALTLTGRVDAKVGGSFDTGVDGSKPIEVGPEVNFHLFPTYDIGIVVLGLDFGLAWYGAITQDGDTYRGMDGGIQAGGGIYAQKTWGGATIRGGLAYSAATEVNGTKEDGVFTIPLTFEYNF